MSKTYDLLNMFYNKPEFIINSFLNKVINHSILKFNLSLLNYYSPFKLCFKKANLNGYLLKHPPKNY
jgi:hypothetical protein